MSTSGSEWKAQGNAALKSKDYDKAIECYSKAIELETNNHTFYSNRSAAYLFKRDYVSVVFFSFFWFYVLSFITTTTTTTVLSILSTIYTRTHMHTHTHTTTIVGLGVTRRGEVRRVETGLGKGIHT
jgi:hypothetical protein